MSPTLKRNLMASGDGAFGAVLALIIFSGFQENTGWGLAFLGAALGAYGLSRSTARRWIALGIIATLSVTLKNFSGVLALVALDLCNAIWVFFSEEDGVYRKYPASARRLISVGVSSFLALQCFVWKEEAPVVSFIFWALLVLLKLVNWPTGSLSDFASQPVPSERKKEIFVSTIYLLLLSRLLPGPVLQFAPYLLAFFGILASVGGRTENSVGIFALLLFSIQPKLFGLIAPLVILVFLDGPAQLFLALAMAGISALILSNNAPAEMLTVAVLSGFLVGRAVSAEKWKMDGKREALNLALIVFGFLGAEASFPGVLNLFLSASESLNGQIFAGSILGAFVVFSGIRVKWPVVMAKHEGFWRIENSSKLVGIINRFRPELRYPKADLKWTLSEMSGYEAAVDRENVKVFFWLVVSSLTIWGIVWLGL